MLFLSVYGQHRSTVAIYTLNDGFLVREAAPLPMWPIPALVYRTPAFFTLSGGYYTFPIGDDQTPSGLRFPV